MKIRCVWEHNGSDSLLYSDNYIGAFTRGATKDIALSKMADEIKSYLNWKKDLAPETFEIEIVQEKLSELNIYDADSDVLFDTEKGKLDPIEYQELKSLALRSAQDFLTLYESIPDKDRSCLPARQTFYGQMPRTAFEMYEHTKNVNDYYFGEIGIDVDNNGTILACRMRGFELLEACPDFLNNSVFEGCQHSAQTNYPLVRQYGLIEKAREYNLENAGKGYLPQFTLSGKATYQSDVTKLPVDVPGIDIKSMPKDQYQVMLEVSQSIWDGGDIRSKKQLTRATSEIDRGKQEVDMYALNDRVNQLYFGILLLDEQLRQNQLLQEDLGRTHQQVSNYMANGIANQSDLDAVSVEILNTKQKRIELESSRQAYLSMLSIFIGKEIASGTTLEKPADTFEFTSLVNNRPELRWFDAQGGQLNVQESSLKTRFRPRFGLFVQGAYGNPGLNMLKDDFSAYYVAGVRMSWNFGSLYTLRNDRRLIDNNRRKLETSRDVFLFNTNLESTQQSSAIQSMRRQMVDDDEIIRLRVNIRKAAEAKVENGTLTVTDMLREITAENLARQTKALHEVQLLMNIWNLKYTLNN